MVRRQQVCVSGGAEIKTSIDAGFSGSPEQARHAATGNDPDFVSCVSCIETP
jgi:hypothetical protein